MTMLMNMSIPIIMNGIMQPQPIIEFAAVFMACCLIFAAISLFLVSCVISISYVRVEGAVTTLLFVNPLCE